MRRGRGRIVGAALLIVHAVLGAWALVGLAEWLSPRTPWPPLTNPELPSLLLLAHWSLMLATAVVFLAAYARRWARTPAAMAAAYLSLASLCAIETFGYLTNDGRFVSMAIEYAAYLTLLVLLVHPAALGARFRASGNEVLA